jgi:hypothetical protein
MREHLHPRMPSNILKSVNADSGARNVTPKTDHQQTAVRSKEIGAGHTSTQVPATKICHEPCRPLASFNRYLAMFNRY